MPMRMCIKCGIEKPLEQFSKDKRMSLGRTRKCYKCNGALQRAYYRDVFKEKAIQATRQWVAKNKSRAAQSHRDWKAKNQARRRVQAGLACKRWAAKNPELQRAHSAANKARHRSGRQGNSFTSGEWIALCKLHGPGCLCCGAESKLVPDHIVPLSRGGSNAIENIQPLCQTCNLKKGIQSTDYRKNGRNWRRDQTVLPI